MVPSHIIQNTIKGSSTNRTDTSRTVELFWKAACGEAENHANLQQFKGLKLFLVVNNAMIWRIMGNLGSPSRMRSVCSWCPPLQPLSAGPSAGNLTNLCAFFHDSKKNVPAGCSLWREAVKERSQRSTPPRRGMSAPPGDTPQTSPEPEAWTDRSIPNYQDLQTPSTWFSAFLSSLDTFPSQINWISFWVLKVALK